MPNSG